MVRILISTLRTGGTGLYLTPTNKCILVDLWWNEAIEHQAPSLQKQVTIPRSLTPLRVTETWLKLCRVNWSACISTAACRNGPVSSGSDIHKNSRHGFEHAE
ncbi:uncharacterized protein PADG_05449 [Paracoccidioides brasiliensis Pb18]|uniref:Uncharacterized protein n=1 Tax=Paracoccidioides brasiliensis (strain Pb18) TaxID=502780 RepID=C1GDW3_PARBD|nr:uncharacterized protein PADG_05449 [Paracoccidioides brasiliensis Pb18]EEH49370.2 hypothetical protein PADG_05449 [Paracoccidioides brasiliensis Pb18]